LVGLSWYQFCCGFIPHWTPWATCARLWTCGLLAHSHVSCHD